MGEGVLIGLPLGIQEVYPCGVGGIAIGNEGDLLAWFCGSQSFVHGDHRGLCSSVIRHVVGSDFQILSGDKEEDEVMLCQDLDVGFITCGDVIDLTFTGKVDPVTIESRRGSVVENRLIGDMNLEDRLHDDRSLSGRDRKRDIEGQDKAEDVFGVVDSCKIDRWSLRCGMDKFLGFIVIFPVLIAEFKLGTAFFLQRSFRLVEFGKRLDAMLTVIVATLIDRDLFPVFPTEKGIPAVGAEVF